MNRIRCFVLMGVVAAVTLMVTGRAVAQLTVYDHFDSPTVDTAKWTVSGAPTQSDSIITLINSAVSKPTRDLPSGIYELKIGIGFSGTCHIGLIGTWAPAYNTCRISPSGATYIFEANGVYTISGGDWTGAPRAGEVYNFVIGPAERALYLNGVKVASAPGLTDTWQYSAMTGAGAIAGLDYVGSTTSIWEPPPEPIMMGVKGGPGQDVAIADDNGIPATPITATDGRNFGNAMMGTGVVTHTFKIVNDAAAVSNLTGLVVTLAGANPADFQVTSGTAPVAPGGETTFTVSFAPLLAGSAGVRSATVSIANNGDGAPWTFAVQGNAVTRLTVYDHFDTPTVDTAKWTVSGAPTQSDSIIDLSNGAGLSTARNLPSGIYEFKIGIGFSGACYFGLTGTWGGPYNTCRIAPSGATYILEANGTYPISGGDWTGAPQAGEVYNFVIGPAERALYLNGVKVASAPGLTDTWSYALFTGAGAIAGLDYVGSAMSIWEPPSLPRGTLIYIR